jgi:hypothetical protein
MPELLTWDRPGAQWDGVVEDENGTPVALRWDGSVPDSQPQKPTNTMANDNLISAEITDEVKTQIRTKLQEIRDLLPFLINLTADERRRIPNISTERGAMDETFATQMANHPDLVPSYVDMDELGRDRRLRSDLLELFSDAGTLCEGLQDTAHTAGNDIFLGYLSYYNNVKQAAKRGVAGADTLKADLSRFFPRGRRAAAPDDGGDGGA